MQLMCLIKIIYNYLPSLQDISFLLPITNTLLLTDVDKHLEKNESNDEKKPILDHVNKASKVVRCSSRKTLCL